MPASGLCLSVCPGCDIHTADVTTASDGELATCLKCGQIFHLPRLKFHDIAHEWLDQPGSDTAPTSARRMSPTALAGISSLTAHCIAAVILSLCWFTLDANSAPTLDCVFAITPNATQGEQFVEIDTIASPASRQTLNAAPASLAPSTRVTSLDLTREETPRVPDPYHAVRSTTNNATWDTAGQIEGVAGLSVGEGRDGTGQGGTSGSLFRGTETAQSVAYVVDASSSMEGHRMARVLQEMETSIRSLRKDQAFFIVFFSERTFPMMWPHSEVRLIEASEDNKQRVLNWAGRVVPENATMPQKAIRIALELRPDIVYFLTDGRIPATTTRTIRDHRSRMTSVNTICIGNTGNARAMHHIAEIGNGVLTMIPEL